MNMALARKPSSPKAHQAGRVAPCTPSSCRLRPSGGQRIARPTIQLPTQLERDTLLTPLWVAECVVQEVERFLKAELPENFAERLAVKAHHLYPRHRHYHKMLNRPGNLGRNYLYVYMRHWTAGWLRRECYGLYKQLPWS